MDTKEYHIAVEEFSDRLYRFAIKLCKNESISQDFVQDAFEKVWIKKDSINFEKVKSYLFRTLYNGFIDYTRKSKVISIEVQQINSSITCSINELD